MNRNMYSLLLAASLLTVFVKASAQVIAPTPSSAGQNVIRPAVPFLRNVPDARSGAMGDAGVATSPDANAIHFNAARLAFLETKAGGSFSYTPWLRNLVNDNWLSNASAYYKIDDKLAVGLGMTYFSLGEYQGRGAGEFVIGGSVARKVSGRLSVSFGLKYIDSDLRAYSPPGFSLERGRSVASDIGMYYTHDISLAGQNMDFAFGASISHMGGSISYSDKASRQYLPTTLKFGPSFSYPIADDSRISFTLDVNKLLVPTLQPYIPAGESPLNGMISSFTDAPGGFSEELKEFYFGGGVECSLKHLLFLRGGYYTEHRDKGNVQYFTLGAGIRYKSGAFDFAYLLPQAQPNALAETMRFTLRLDVGQSEQ